MTMSDLKLLKPRMRDVAAFVLGTLVAAHYNQMLAEGLVNREAEAQSVLLKNPHARRHFVGGKPDGYEIDGPKNNLSDEQMGTPILTAGQ